MEQLLTSLFTQPTAHHLCDSGSIYGRKYQRNAERDLPAEPQATLKTTEWGVEVSVSTFLHMKAVLETDRFCEEFNQLPCETWDGDFYGTSAEQQQWLEDRMFTPEGDAQNSYNWENLFDQTIQYQRFERNGEEYILLQIHGGCDVRSGYSDAKLFKFGEWDGDSYWMDDRCSFSIPRAQLEAGGYESPELQEGDEDYDPSIEFHAGQCEVYDPRDQENHDLPKGFRWPENLTLEGSANAVEH